MSFLLYNFDPVDFFYWLTTGPIYKPVKLIYMSILSFDECVRVDLTFNMFSKQDLERRLYSNG